MNAGRWILALIFSSWMGALISVIDEISGVPIVLMPTVLGQMLIWREKREQRKGIRWKQVTNALESIRLRDPKRWKDMLREEGPPGQSARMWETIRGWN